MSGGKKAVNNNKNENWDYRKELLILKYCKKQRAQILWTKQF